MVGIHYRWDFIGLSTDQKPTPETSEKVVNGSTFYCSDTSKLYVYCDGTWYERKALGGGGGGGTSDFNDLLNRPKYNGVTMTGATNIPEVVSYSAGTGITLSGTTFSADTTTLATKAELASKQNITDNSLETSNKTVPGAINEVNRIAKGANKALSFTNYVNMISEFNSLAASVYSVGQNIYIVTVNVPDLWVSKVESTSSTYTYTDDATVINDLETNGYIQVGYYKLSMLETQKVDLANYVTKTDYATTSTPGLVRTSNDYSIQVSGTSGLVFSQTKTLNQYNDASNIMFISKGTLENVITGKGLDLKQLSTFDSTKTQVLKNINGSLIWVDE